MTERDLSTDAVNVQLAEAVRRVPATLSAEEALAGVPVMALLASHADAAKAYPTIVSTVERAELDRVKPLRDVAPKRTSRAYRWWSVIALVVALIAPALIMTGRTGSAALDPVSGALPSGLAMAVALGLFVWLEPKRTSNPLYRAGNFGAPMFVLITVIWAIGVSIVLREGEELQFHPEAILGLVLQIVATIGCLVLAVFAFRHDRERPQWADGRKVRESSALPAELAESPEYRAKLERRVTEWRRHVYGVSTADERAALLAAELEAVRLLADRGTLTPAQFDEAQQRVRSRSDWR
ncbi:hypothetical protein [Agromyces sp. PvR057]|uniref:hypothetical protein n=1 Tax=Agromyces sp. PvR057 TaxID=3156403 RepID=UPI0033917919